MNIMEMKQFYAIAQRIQCCVHQKKRTRLTCKCKPNPIFFSAINDIFIIIKVLQFIIIHKKQVSDLHYVIMYFFFKTVHFFTFFYH